MLVPRQVSRQSSVLIGCGFLLFLVLSTRARHSLPIVGKYAQAHDLFRTGTARLDPILEKYSKPSSPTDPVPWYKAPLFPAWKGSTAHTIPAFPRKIELTRGPTPAELVFAIATDYTKALRMSTLWKLYLSQGSHCLVLLPPEEKAREAELQKAILSKSGIHCHVRASPLERYQHRVLSLPDQVYNMNETVRSTFKWIVLGDDDTIWLDLRALQRLLGFHDHNDKILIASPSERIESVSVFGKMAFGGGGMLLSAGLSKSMLDIMSACMADFGKAYGGDEMLTRCAGRAKNVVMEEAWIEGEGLHQMDILGLGTGFFEYGLPFLNVHHVVNSWTQIFPEWLHQKDDFRSVQLLADAFKFLGADNMFRRYVFDDGYTTLVNGYAVTAWGLPLTREDMTFMEYTWTTGKLNDLVYPWRGAAAIGRPSSDSPNYKSVYYLSSIKVNEEDGDTATFTYKNENGKRVRIIMGPEEKKVWW